MYNSIRFPIQVVNKEGYVVYVNELFTDQWRHTLSEIKEYNIFIDYRKELLWIILYFKTKQR